MIGKRSQVSLHKFQDIWYKRPAVVVKLVVWPMA